MNHRQRLLRDYAGLAAVALPLLAVPFLVDPFLVSLAILTLYWAYLGNAWNIMGGYAGQFSFGHAMFYGIGAYTSTMLLLRFQLSPWLGMLAGAGLAALFGAGAGYLLFRFGVRGHFFALGTFALAEMLRLIAAETEFINRSIGVHIPLIRGDSWWRLQFERTQSNYYFVILGLFVLGMAVTIGLHRSHLGAYFQAIRENEEAAAALGVDVLRYKVYAVALSAALTAIGGSFFAQYFLFVDPTLAFGVSISVQILLRPIVGGVGTVWGPLVGALLLTPLAELTRAFVRTPPPFLEFLRGRSGVDVMIYGAILILVILFIPDGLVGAGRRLWTRLSGSSGTERRSS